jgi:hypothetical protein
MIGISQLTNSITYNQISMIVFYFIQSNRYFINIYTIFMKVDDSLDFWIDFDWTYSWGHWIRAEWVRKLKIVEILQKKIVIVRKILLNCTRYFSEYKLYHIVKYMTEFWLEQKQIREEKIDKLNTSWGYIIKYFIIKLPDNSGIEKSTETPFKCILRIFRNHEFQTIKKFTKNLLNVINLVRAKNLVCYPSLSTIQTYNINWTIPWNAHVWICLLVHGEIQHKKVEKKMFANPCSVNS